MPIRKSCCILRQVVFTSVIVKSYQYILFSKDVQQVQKENLIPIELCSGVQRRRLGGGRGPLSMYHVRSLLYQPIKSHQINSPSTTLTCFEG